MGQIRALKIALERRLKRKIKTKESIMHWIVDHAGVVISKCQVGHDGKTPHRRLMGKDSEQRFVEMGEQVLAKPKRNPRTTRKLS